MFRTDGGETPRPVQHRARPAGRRLHTTSTTRLTASHHRKRFAVSHAADDAAVDRICGASHEAGLVGAEVEDEVRDLLGPAHPPHRLVLAQLLEHLRLLAGVVLLDEAVDESCVHAAWADAVAADPALAH